jgi:hypothetical protein
VKVTFGPGVDEVKFVAYPGRFREGGREREKESEGEDCEVIAMLKGVGSVEMGGDQDPKSGVQGLMGILRMGVEKRRVMIGSQDECMVNKMGDLHFEADFDFLNPHRLKV